MNSTFVRRVVDGDKEDLQGVAGLGEVIVLEVLVTVEPPDRVSLVREVDDEDAAVSRPLTQVLLIHFHLKVGQGIVHIYKRWDFKNLVTEPWYK